MIKKEIILVRILWNTRTKGREMINKGLHIIIINTLEENKRSLNKEAYQKDSKEAKNIRIIRNKDKELDNRNRTMKFYLNWMIYF